MNRFRSLAIGTMLLFVLNAPAQQAATASGAANKDTRVQPPAQEGVPAVGEQLKTLTIQLGLSADQQARIRPILQRLHDATLSIVQDQKLSADERLARVRPERFKARDQISEMLNDDQKKKLDQYLAGPHPEVHGNLSGAASAAKPRSN